MPARPPRFPVYIPSKSRALIARTPARLDEMGVPYRLIVEAAQHDEYADVYSPERILVLPDRYRAEYDTCLPGFDETQSKGSGPARNYAWEHSISEGHTHHWVVDDNIQGFYRLHQNTKTYMGDALPFVAMEDFTLRYRNLGLSGPQYDFFRPARCASEPFTLNTRIFSCILIRNDIPYRWRARYNEDLDLSIRVLKGGWCTVLFNAFLQKKMSTQLIAGGNTEAFYAAEGTKPKSDLIVRLHPDVCRLAARYKRDHHHADFTPWKARPLIRRDDAEIPAAGHYRTTLIERPNFRKRLTGQPTAPRAGEP